MEGDFVDTSVEKVNYIATEIIGITVGALPTKIFIVGAIAVTLKVPQTFFPIQGEGCQVLLPVGRVKENETYEDGTYEGC